MPLVGNTNEQKIWNYLYSKIGNAYGVSGLMGNLFAESGLKSNNLQNTGNTRLGMTDDEYVKAVDNGIYTKEQFIYDSQGFGIAQWTYWSRKKAFYEYVKYKNKSIGDLEASLDFLYKELNEDYKSVITTLKTATSVLEASNAVLFKFERPADQSKTVQNKRAGYGQKYYDKYASNNITNNDKGDTKDMSYTKGSAVKLSSNFKSTEFDCHGKGCCSLTYIDGKLVEYLQKIRDHFGKPVTITSAYRCQKHNKNIGGATSSYHTKGMAADIVVSDIAPLEVAKYAESIGILGIGLYETSKDGYFVHIDTRTTKSFWYGQAQARRTTFGGKSSVEPAQTSSSLKRGSIGDSVKTLQNKLIALGYSCGKYGADGDFGASTESSVRNFQKEMGLVVDGIVGKNTLNAIENALKITKVEITANILNVRAGAGTKYKILTTVRKGSIHKLLEEKNGWGRISSGWISSTYYKKL